MASVPPPPPAWSPPSPDSSPLPSTELAPSGGFWRRAVALLIDGLILTVPIASVVGVLSLMIDFSTMDNEDQGAVALLALLLIPMAVGGMLIVSWLYEALMTSSAGGATLGKQAMGMRIVRADGARLSFGRATARYFLKTLITPLVPFGIGYLLAAFTARKRALHDLLADTLVLKTR